MALLNAGAFGFLVLGLSGAAHADLVEIVVPEITAGKILTPMLRRRQANHTAPMLSVDLFKIPIFALSTITAICFVATHGLAFVALPFCLEQGLGRSQIETGFLITPWPIMIALTAMLAGRLSDRYPTGLLEGAGLATLSLGMITPALLPAHPGSFDIIWRMAVCGTGFVFFSISKPEAAGGQRPAQPGRRRQRGRYRGPLARPDHRRHPGCLGLLARQPPWTSLGT